MRVVETFDMSIFEQLRALGADVDLAIKLAVAGKSLAESLYTVNLQGTEATHLFESFVKGQFGGLRGLIESDTDAYNTPTRQAQINRWVKAGTFAEELREYALATQCQSHGATRNKTKSTCYGTLFAYLEVSDLTDPVVSTSTNLCHLDAMVDRVTTREGLIKFLDLLVQNRHARGVQERVLSKGFPNLDRHIAWYSIVEETLYTRNVKTFKAENPSLTLALRSLGLEEIVGDPQADSLTKALVDQVLVDHANPPFGDRSKVSTEGLMAKYLGHLMVEAVSTFLPEDELEIWCHTANGLRFPEGRLRFDDMVTEVRVYAGKKLIATAKVNELLNAYGDMTARLAHARWAVPHAIRQALLRGKTDGIIVLGNGTFA